MGVAKFGDWRGARSVLSRIAGGFHTTLARALRQEAEGLRKEIVEGLASQAPGGQTLRPLAETTLAARRLERFGGTKALIRRGDLRKSIAVDVRGLTAFVGVPSKVVDGENLVDIAQMNEFGAGPFVIVMTPAMRRYLFVLLRNAGVTTHAVGGGGAASSGTVVVRIPERPFLRPAIAAWRKGVRERFLRRVGSSLGLGGGA